MDTKKVTKQIKEITQEFKKAKFDYWFDYGTLLGALQQGKLFQWDDDIDLGTWYANKELIEKKLYPIMEKRGYTASHKSVPKLGIVSVQFRSEGNLGVDLHYYRKRSNKAWTVLGYTAPKKGVAGVVQKIAFRIRSGIVKISPNFFHDGLGKKIQDGYLKKSRKSQAGSDKVHKSYVPIVLPTKHFNKLETFKLYGTNIPVPSKPVEYLKLHYGDGWNIPKTHWVYWKDNFSIDLDWQIED